MWESSVSQEDGTNRQQNVESKKVAVTRLDQICLLLCICFLGSFNCIYMNNVSWTEVDNLLTETHGLRKGS